MVEPAVDRLAVSTAERTDLIDITERVAACLPEAIDFGTTTVFVPHTTAAVVVNEAEPGLLVDLQRAIDDLFPGNDDYQHDRIDGNAAAHLRATVLGESVTMPVVDGQLALGTWQSILFVECDGPRDRHLRVVTLGS